MKKLLILVELLLICTLSNAQYPSFVKVSERESWDEYSKYCDDSVYIDIYQYGKLTIPYQNVPGLNWEQAKMQVGEFTDAVFKPDTMWYQLWKPGLKATKYTVQYNEKLITRIVKIKVPRRVKNQRDWRENWITEKIVHPIDWKLNTN